MAPEVHAATVAILQKVAQGGSIPEACEELARLRNPASPPGKKTESSEETARFRVLAESLPEKIFTARADGETDYFNHQWEVYTGLPVEEVLRLGWREFVHPEDIASKMAHWEKAIAERVPFEFEHRFRRADGVYRWHISRARPLLWSDGSVAMWVGSNMDVDDLKRTHAKLQHNQTELRAALDTAEQAQAEAEAASRAKDHFLAVLSHELRTPLTPVLMAVSALRSNPALPPEVRETMEMIQRNIRLEARLIDDLLDLTRIARNKREIQPTPMDLHAAIRQALEVSSPDVVARKHEVILLLEAKDSHVRGDLVLLQQVFWNLLKNAVKFTPEGGRITVKSWNEAGKICVEVSDTGRGISPDVLPRIFEPFEQGTDSFTREFGGLGLGLSISKATIDAHSGVLQARSDGRDKGATFRLELDTLQDQS